MDLRTDPDHCGTCTKACAGTPNGVATCKASTCGLACNDSYRSCGGTCKAESAASCGPACEACTRPDFHGVPACGPAACTVACNLGYTLASTAHCTNGMCPNTQVVTAAIDARFPWKPPGPSLNVCTQANIDALKVILNAGSGLLSTRDGVKIKAALGAACSSCAFSPAMTSTTWKPFVETGYNDWIANFLSSCFAIRGGNACGKARFQLNVLRCKLHGSRLRRRRSRCLL